MNPPAPSSSDSPGSVDPRQVSVTIERDHEGKPKHFSLTLAKETVALSPGKAWLKTDEFKWVTRGLMEAPQSFHVEPNGTVDINGEKIALDDPEAAVKLAHELNKHHAVSAPKKPVAASSAAAKPVPVSRTPLFKAKLDQFGHLVIECTRGAERVETGLRGLPSLVQNGLMLAPKKYHVDPLHRGIELDGTFFEATEAGARQLTEVLNTQYAPSLDDEKDTAIEIRENPAAATGFDIHFVTVVSGARFEVKGHLSQEKLDLLQDTNKCDLLQPGIILRLSPPNLLFRRRRPDGGDDHISELPDVHYRHITAPELQRLFNHPLIRRGGESAATAALHAEEHPADLVELHVARNPQNKALLWLEGLTTAGGAPQGRAFTHHNVADLQHQGAFLPHLDVTLSLDHHTLSILNKETNHEDQLTLDSHSTDSLLAEAGHMLTAALRPPRAPAPAPTPAPTLPPAPAAIPSPLPAPPPPATSVPSPTAPQPAAAPPLPVPPPPPVATPTEPARPVVPTPVPPPPSAPPPLKVPAEPPPPPPVSAAAAPVPPPVAQSPAPPPVATPQPTSPPPEPEPEPGVDPALLAVFENASLLEVNPAVFGRLATCLGLPVQDILLTLPRAFEDRRFQVLSFSHPDIETILDLRSDSFYGFYLSHVSEQRVLLVYACKGRHVEWGPDRCLLQSAVSAEPSEFKHNALLGLAQDAESNFVFVVTPAYRDWAKGFEKTYLEVCARFVTPRDIALAPDQFTLIWPEPAQGAADGR